ncbi:MULTISPECIES: hypothetical protein [unclassified Methylobacterium]|uniref:hypothetical protein n=1 Tax=unclassified Methylobacterium TaxID=2615210 RepID=UPI00030E46F0|nr:MULTISPECIES: hypothetical protein [Methylobacterium]WFT80789.1 hypothetical protein QA634_02480 [Methylobacterium nodulans]
MEIRGPASSEYWTIPSGLDVAEAREADPPRLTEATTSPLGTVAAAGLDAREAALTAARVRDALSSERLPIGNTAPQNLRTLFRV